MPLVKISMFIFSVIFLDCVMLPQPQAMYMDHGGPRTSDLSIERQIRNHFTTTSTKQSKAEVIGLPITEGGGGALT